MLNRRIPGAVGTRAARSFASASTQYLTADTGFGLGANDPCYIVVRARRESTAFICVAYLGSPVAGTDSRRIFTTTTDAINAWSQDAVGANTSVASAAGSFSTTSGWTSIIAEFASASSRRIIVNGTATSNSTTRTLTAAPTVFRIGTLGLSSQPFSGGVAQAAIFAGTASDALIAMHARGVHPTQLPGQLLECWDLDRTGPIVGLVRGTVLTPTNGGSLTVGPPIQGAPRVAPLFVGSPGAGAGGQTLDLPALASGALLGAPTVTAGEVGLTLPALASGAALHVPSLTATASLTLPALAGGTTLHTPTFTPDAVALGLPALGATAALYAPTLADAGLSLALPVLEAGTTLYTPTLTAGAVAVALPVLLGDEQLYPPRLGSGAWRSRDGAAAGAWSDRPDSATTPWSSR